MVEIQRQEIAKVSVSTCAANGHVQFHVRDNHMLETDEFVSVDIHSVKQLSRFRSVFKGVKTLQDYLS